MEKAFQQLYKLKEEEKALPEWYMVVDLFHTWRDFIDKELTKEKTRAELVVKPVTKWLPDNVGPGDVHIAWVLHNEGPSFMEVDHIALRLGKEELECDTEKEVLFQGDQRCVEFTLSKLELSKLESSGIVSELSLTPVATIIDMWALRTESFDKLPSFERHTRFGVPTAFRRGIIVDEELIGRETELNVISTELIESDPPKKVLYLWGPPGIGKKVLVGALGDRLEGCICYELRIEDLWERGRRLPQPKSPERILQEIGQALNGQEFDVVFLTCFDPMQAIEQIAVSFKYNAQEMLLLREEVMKTLYNLGVYPKL